MPPTLPPTAQTQVQVQSSPVRTEPRQKMPSRSLTTQPGSQPAPAPTRPRRTMSEDSSSQDIRLARQANTRTKSQGAAGQSRPAKDKPSTHADAIDVLDNSGIGVGMFHHDGPFDACAPSRNKSTRAHRAPIFAFNEDALGGDAGVPVYDKRISPRAQAAITAMAQSDGNGGPYPTRAFQGPPPRSSGSSHGTTMMGGKLGPSPRKMTLTEAWGTAEPEPFEEFSAGRASARSSLEHPPEGGFEAMYRRDARAAAAARRGESLDITSPRRTKLPPPQPIFLPGTRTNDPNAVPAAGGGAAPPAVQVDPASPVSPATDGGQRTPMVQRTRSLMQRFRRMRDNPNVPVGGPMAVPDGYFSDTHATTPTPWVTTTPGPRAPGPRIRVENADASGAVARAPSQSHSRPMQQRAYTHGHRPSKEQNLVHTVTPIPESPPVSGSPASPEEPFVLVDKGAAVAAAREKALPIPPGTQSLDDVGYYNRPIVQQQNGGGANGVGRKVSLYKKMKDAVVGGGGAKY